MNTALSSLSRLFSSTRHVAQEPDPGDMGTCFGMEMTLQSEPPALESARTPGASAPAEAASPAAVEGRKRGWRRWGARPERKDPLAA